MRYESNRFLYIFGLWRSCNLELKQPIIYHIKNKKLLVNQLAVFGTCSFEVVNEGAVLSAHRLRMSFEYAYADVCRAPKNRTCILLRSIKTPGDSRYESTITPKELGE